MKQNDSPAERRKRDAEFQEFKRREKEQLETEMRALAELLLDIYEEQQHKKNGSTHTGS